MPDIASLLCQTELPFFGYNLSGLPLGLETGYTDVVVDENFENKHDSLREIGTKLLTRPIYFEQGFTKNKELFLREPALHQWIEYDQALHKNFGWRVRIVDAYRPWTVQQQGFCWGLKEIVKHRAEINWQDFEKLLRNTIEGRTNDETTALLENYIDEANDFFALVPYRMDDGAQTFPQLSDHIISAAANLGIITTPLDKYAITPHSTGGQVDCEWIDEETGLAVNVGVPVDLQGIESAMPFFEDRVATILEKKLEASTLQTLESRQQFYREQINKKPALQTFLQKCGVDLQKLFTSETYFQKIWEQIKHNRRLVVHTGSSFGLKFYGFECWDATANDARGGIRCLSKKIVSGSGIYARHTGQSECAWGNATKLWEEL